MSKEEFRDFVRGYLEALSFTDAGPDGPLSSSAKVADTAFSRIVADCQAFVVDNADMLTEATARQGYSWGQAGRDFWFNRNGHGVGYWDRQPLKMNNLGARLAEKALDAHESSTYMGDDGMIHVEDE